MNPQIKELAKTLQEGETKNVKCPFCVKAWEEQGRPFNWSPRVSMSITREGVTVLYHCFRASCTGGGVVHLLDDLNKAALKETNKSAAKFEPRLYQYRTIPAVLEYLPLHLTAKELKEQHIRWAIDRKTVVYPIFDINAREVGVVDRSYRDREPKAISYWFNNVPKIHFPLSSRKGTSLLLVEDIPSAIVAERFTRAAALLGTHISPRTITHLRTQFDTLRIALDADATAEALKLSKKYSLFFKEIEVIPLKKDIKNMSPKELTELFKDLKV